MHEMTDEEYDALEEFVTNNPPKVDPSKARIRIPPVRRKTPEEIIGEPVRERVAAAV
jgi:hypothetical protein